MASELTPEAIAELRRLPERLHAPRPLFYYDPQERLWDALPALLDAAERCAAAEDRAEAAENLLASYFQRDDERRAKREAQAKAAGELLRAAKAVGYITGQPGYCGDHAVVSLTINEDTAKQWNVALQAAERAGVKP